jgi:hypothetical protein
MAELRTVELSVEDAARLLHVQPQTIRRRVRAGELQTAETIGPAPASVRLVPGEDWIRVEDASALLRVAPATIRSNITRGRLTGRREKNGRWRVLLRAVLEDPRCDPTAIEAFGGEAAGQDDKTPGHNAQVGRTHSLHRSVFVRLDPEESELLERCRDRHGTIRAAVVFGLEAIDRDDLDVDVAEVHSERELYREQLERVRGAHRGLQERAEGRLVDELYCPVCETFVPIEETDRLEVADGTEEIYHRKHGHRSGSKIRSNTVIARRAKLSLDPAA